MSSPTLKAVTRVFLSHSSHDIVAARALKGWLEQADPGLADEVFLDEDRDTGIPAGVRWKDALRIANERCEAVICLLSAHWDDSRECQVEYRSAEDRGKPIFPVRLEPLTGRDITAEWQRCDLFGEGAKTSITVDGHAERVEFLTEGLMRLLQGLRGAGIAPDSFTWPPEDEPDRAPYPGWRPLEEADAAVYFGRDAQLHRAMGAIRGMRASGEEKLFVIVGSSGAGKSSFLRAGVLPRLRRDDRHFLPMPVIRPQRYPITGPHGLAASIYGLRTAFGLTAPTLGAIKAGAADPKLVGQWLAEAQRAASNRLVDAEDVAPPTIVLPIDQAEELFVADADEQCGKLLSVLSSLLSDRSPIIAVATIRSDSYAPLQAAPDLAVIGTRVFDDLKPMPIAQFRQVICGPAERANAAGGRVSWSAELLDRLLADCTTGADTLPLLALTLARLHTDFGGAEIGLAEYETLGGLQQVVQHEVDEVLSSDPDERARQLDRLHGAFIPWLATVNPDSDLPMRRVARLSDLPADSEPLIDALVTRRLLVKDERDGEVVVEVALESLLRHWDELSGWLRAEAGDLKDADGVEHAARLWNHNERQDDWLLEGAWLAETETLAAKPGFRDRLNAIRDFLLASRQREDRRTREREEQAQALAAAEGRAKIEAQNHARVLARRARVLKALLAAVAVVAVVAVVAGLVAWNAKRDADASKRVADTRMRDEVARSLSSNSQEMLMDVWPGDGSDVLALHMMLAARTFPSRFQNYEYYMLGALQYYRDLIKMTELPATVYKVAFSPDGNTIVAAGEDGIVRQLDSQKLTPKGPLLQGHQGKVLSVAYSGDGARIASGDTTGAIRLWDAKTGRQIGEPLAGHTLPVTSLAFSPDGRLLVSGSGDRTLQMWDTTTGTPVGEPLRGHDDAVMSVAVSPDGRTIVSGSFDKTIRLWRTGSRQPDGEPIRGHEEGVAAVAFSPDGHTIASGSLDNTIRIWDVTSKEAVGEPLRGHQGAVSSVAFTGDGDRIASGSADRTIRIWDVPSARQVGILTGHRSAVSGVAFHPDNRRLVSGSDDHTVRVWDTVSWQPIITGNREARADFVDGGRTIATGGFAEEPTIRYWDAATGRQIGRPVSIQDSGVESLTPIDRHRALSMDSANTVRLWEAAAGVVIGRPFPLRDTLPLMRYSPETHRVVLSPAMDSIEVRDVASFGLVGPPIRTESTVSALDLSPDGQVVATGDVDRTVRLWDVETGSQLGPAMNTDDRVGIVAFSDDGRLVAAGDHETEVRVWDARTGDEIGGLTGDALVSSLDFSADGTTLAAGLGDGHIQVIDIASGVQYGPAWIGHTSGVSSLEFSPDGTKLLSASADGTARVWPVPRPDPKAVCAKLTHNMSQDAWKYRIPPEIEYVPVCPDLPDGDGG